MLVRSDDHGTPALEADHFVSLTASAEDADALDHRRLWPVLDALQTCVATGRDCEPATVEGSWSDGRTVAPAVVRSAP